MMLTLYSESIDCLEMLAVNGPFAMLTTIPQKQKRRATFSGASRKAITVHFAGNTMRHTTAHLLKPDGTEVTDCPRACASSN